MKINNKIIYIDVDWTLLLPSEGCFIPTTPNEKLIEKIKAWKLDGHTIIVWTSNPKGVKWAKDAVKICEIEGWVDLCLPKPKVIVDDEHLEYKTIDPVTLELKECSK